MSLRYQHCVGRPSANKAKRGRGWEEVRETWRKHSSRETNGKYVCALNQRFRQWERAWSQTIVSDSLRLLFLLLFLGKKAVSCTVVLPLRDWVWVLCAFAAAHHTAAPSLSGILEQHLESYICCRAWASCCRSPKPAGNQGLDQVVMSA